MIRAQNHLIIKLVIVCQFVKPAFVGSCPIAALGGINPIIKLRMKGLSAPRNSGPKELLGICQLDQ